MNGTQRRPIGGWLLYYCISRSVFEPAYFVWTARKLGSSIEFWIEILLALAGIAAVILIVKRRQEAFVLIGSDLILRVLFSIAVFARKYLHPVSGLNQKIDPHLIALLIFAVGLVGPLAWLLYFKLSKHVFAVLGRNLGFNSEVCLS